MLIKVNSLVSPLSFILLFRSFRKEDSPSFSPSLSPLQPSLARVSAFKMILSFISRFLCTVPFLRPPPPPRARGKKIKRRTNTIFKPPFRGERTPQPALNQRNIPVFEPLRLGSRSLLSLSSLALFFLTHRIKKTGGRDTIRPYGRDWFRTGASIYRDKRRGTKQQRRLTKWKREWNECIVI